MTDQPVLPGADNDPDRIVVEAQRYRPPATGLEMPRARIPWMPLAVGCLLVVTLFAVWFVLSARSVGIQVIPANASVTVHAWPAPRVANHWLMLRGPRRVTASAPGYTPFAGTIEISAAEIQSHTIELLPLPGHLRVTVTPVSSAEIAIGGAARGRVPGLIRDVPAGEQRVEIRADRFLPFETRVLIEGKGIEQGLAAQLDPAWADVSVASQPDSAEVRIDGEVRGHTPLAVELLAGRRVVEVVKPGYKRWQQTLRIEPGVAVNLGEIVLSKADGQVSITSTPSAATVTLNGQFIGMTPLDTAVSPDKEHQLKLIKAGYLAQQRSVSVASGKRAEVAVELVAELATIELQTIPADAELLINGTPSGNATQRLELPTHEHEFTIRSPGYATYQTRITPRKGVARRFRVRLKTLAENGRAAASTARPSAARNVVSQGSITTFAGQTMKLFHGGNATLGSSRRSSGHQANEVQREVRLERPFYLSVSEVSNGEFRLFLATHSSGDFNGQSLDEDSQAASNVSWAQAALYCNWLSRRDGLAPFYRIRYGEVLGVSPDSTGYRLPTEAEWEWAARPAAATTPTVFPWGDEYPPRTRAGNYADQAAARIMGDTLAGYDDGFAVSAPNGSFAPNLNGLYDMDGNVAEWVHDFYAAALPSMPMLDPLGPASSATHVIKGGSWALAGKRELRASFRDSGSTARDDVGFRLARYAR